MGAVLIIIWSAASWALWFGIAIFAFFSGPTLGFAYDLNNRITRFSELGTAVLMFFLNLGASIVPYIISAIWDSAGAGPSTLPWSIIGFTVLSLAALYLSLVVKNDYSRG